MFQRPTVLIIGAGAHHEFNMPLGATLLNNVAAALNIKFEGGTRQISGNGQLYNALKSKFRDSFNLYRAAGC